MRRIAAFFVLLTSLAGLNIAHAADYTKITDVRVAMDDGVPLAADVYIPTGADRDGDGLYPCVVELTPYRKESRAAEGAGYLPAQGIALIEVDARGTGGSGGEYDIVFSVREQHDAANWIEWAATTATKPGGGKLCEETIGMYGGSYSGIIQYLVATLPQAAEGDLPAAPPHLATITPARAYGDLYRDIVYQGGMVTGSFGVIWSGGTTAYYTEPPTDAQSGGDGATAWTDHLFKNDAMIKNYLDAPYEDATFTSNGSPIPWQQKLYTDSSALPRIQNLQIPVLHLAGFFDAFTRGQLMMFDKAHAQETPNSPNFLIVGPWNHGGTHFISPDEGFRQNLADWYHYWLEDRANGTAAPDWIANGFDRAGARVKYFQTTSGVINGMTPTDGQWKDAADWPVPGISVEKMYLRGDGAITGSPDAEITARQYASNPASGNGEILSRWDNAAGTPQPQWDQRVESGRGLTYQTPALNAPLSIAGPIGMSLWASVTGAQGDKTVASQWPAELQTIPPYLDTDFVVKVSDVAPDGTATLVTQGYLRASHRAYDDGKSLKINGEMMGPYHLHTLAALDPPVSGEAREYKVEIWPTAKTFAAGHQIRIDITSSDTPNHLTLTPPTVNAVHGGPGMNTSIELPVVP